MRPAKLWQRKGRTGWFATVNGKQVCFGLDHEAAKKAFHASKASRRPVDRSRMSVTDLIDIYLEASEREVQRTTHANYVWYLQKLEQFAGWRIAAELRPLDLTAWCATRARWNAGTRRSAIEIARRWSRWCKLQGYLDSDPFEGAKLPRVKPREAAAAGALDAFLAEITSPALRDVAIVLYDTGARPGEVVTLSAGQIDWQASAAEVRGKMGGRVISLTDRVLTILLTLAKRYPDGPLLRTRHGNAWNSSSLNRQYREICARAGVKVVPYHNRHALWARAHRAGVDSIVVAKQLGHSSLKMLSRVYAHVEPDMLKDAVERSASPISADVAEPSAVPTQPPLPPLSPPPRKHRGRPA